MSIDADFVVSGPLAVQKSSTQCSAGRDASGIQPGVRDETGGVVSGGGKRSALSALATFQRKTFMFLLYRQSI